MYRPVLRQDRKKTTIYPSICIRIIEINSIRSVDGKNHAVSKAVNCGLATAFASHRERRATETRKTYNIYNAGLTLGSNISEAVDFRLSYTGRYNVSRSSSEVRTLDNTYFSQTAKAETTFVLWKRLVLRANADYNYYRGITDTFLEERLICNALLGVKLFRNRLGEVSVGVNDLLDQNGTTFRRTVTGTTLRNVTNLGVGRYVSFQFTYNLRLFRRQSNAVMDALQGK